MDFSFNTLFGNGPGWGGSSSSGGLSSSLSGSPNLRTAFGDVGGAVSDLFGAYGDFISSSAYDNAAAMEDKAAALSGQDVNLTNASTEIQAAQMERKVNSAIGGQESDVAGAGFASEGSALWLHADSMRQGAIANSLIKTQGAITAQGYQIQQLSEQSTANQDRSLGSQSAMGGIGDIIGAGLKLAPLLFLL